jgi:hypothetical protein
VTLNRSDSGDSRSTCKDASRLDLYRDTLEAWAAWWNNVGRQHYRFYIVPPITMLNEALFCTACAGVGPYEAETGPERCQVCGRRVP